MSEHGAADAPSAADRKRLRAARAAARYRVEEIERFRRAAIVAAFREELRSAIRSVSPFLLALLEVEGLNLDDVAHRIAPHQGWPRRPRLSRHAGRVGKWDRHSLRHYVAGWSPNRRAVASFYRACHGYTIDRAGGDWFRVEVVDHSLEVIGEVGPVRFHTRFGELRLALGQDMPDALAIACIGRLIDEVVALDALRGRGWRISAVEAAEGSVAGRVLVVAIPSIAYRMPL